ncbi:MAG TPA: hypothetical protein VGE74_13745 [Gemmata sp.]
MCARTLAAVALLGLAGPAARAADPPPCAIDQLDKSWNLALRSVAVADGRTPFQAATKDVQVTLAFTKDVEDVTAIRTAFEGQVVRVAPKEQPLRAVFYFFDKDNVVVAKAFVEHRDGEITGQTHDAFRVTTQLDPATFAKVKRIELRPSKRAK